MKIKILRQFTFIFILTLVATWSQGQESLSGLSVNPVVQAKVAAMTKVQSDAAARLQEGLDTIPVSLPFLDDFSALGVFPSSDRWIDHFGFENDDFPVFPVNMGAMTLDAINDSGRMYKDAIPGPATFVADRLTSRFIRLDSLLQPVPRALSPADSVYLSFWYQPQGRGKAPQKNDSLVLRFLVRPAYDTLIPGAGLVHIPDQWERVWRSEGMPLDTFYMRNNKWFVQVFIPVRDSIFFKKKFRFQFYNYASLASSTEPSWQSNTDQWNIDQVYLNIGRSRFDTVFPEIRFITRPTGLLKRYSSMPYDQYSNDPTNELRDTLDVLISNRDIIPHLSNYSYKITQEGGSYSKSYDGGSYNIQPFHVSPFVSYPKFAHPELPFLLPPGTSDSAVFPVTHVIRDVAPQSKLGDTSTILQKFYNYFAYDDGTPEASYGLSPAGSKLAYKFKLNKSPDTLRAIRFYFNETLSHANDQFFFLCVWNDNAGKPGDTIYSDYVLPKYADSLNKFVTYHMDPPLVVTGTFYVGTIQTTDDNLSIGFDRYNNSQQQIFYNAAGSWSNSAYSGSLLIRPVLGKPIPLGKNEAASPSPAFTLFPNPCKGNSLFINIAEKQRDVREIYDYQIMDIMGRSLQKGTFTGGNNQVAVSGLADGIYLLTVSDRRGNPPSTKKLLISK